MTSSHRATLGAALLAMCAASAPAIAADAPAPVTFKLNAMNGSSESGTATLTPDGDKTVVVLKLTGAPDAKQPAHFHTGTCSNYGPRPLYPLEPVEKGYSKTTLDEPIGKLTDGSLVINVHHSLDDIATIASCGLAKG
ncbi:MAG TPA: hypothetical protein VMD91_18030 [Candidatus Sulfotelmatobacter sp.]|nr:hypothetical protein [Candidatus Sulfotelmatobacter sp.]